MRVREALDGKTLQGIQGKEIPGVHLVSAHTAGSGAMLTRVTTVGKGQELAVGTTCCR